jgi:hypothetical protein
MNDGVPFVAEDDYHPEVARIGEQQKQDLAAMREKYENGDCEATWGTCTGKLGAFAFEFGKPSKTPHRCKGERKHRSRLHACEVCGIVGHRILPTKLSKAGQELSRAVAAAEKDRAIGPGES